MKNKFVVREYGSGTCVAMQRFFAEQGIQLKTSMEMPNNEAIKQAVAAGLGLGGISLHTLQQELALKQVKILQVEKMPIMRIWYIVHHKQKILSPAMILFIKFVSQNTQQIWSTSTLNYSIIYKPKQISCLNSSLIFLQFPIPVS